MLRLRKHPAGGPSNSTGNGSLKDDSPTTGHTSPSPTTEGSPTISPTTSLTEHTTTVDSGATESTPKSSGSSSTSDAGAPATETQSAPTTTEKQHESSSSLSTSTAVLTTSTTNTHPSDSLSSSTTSQPEQTSTTSNLLTTSQASTTTTVTQQTPTTTTTTEHPPESSTSLTTSKVEPTTRQQDSPTPLPSNPSTTPETRTTDIQVTTSTANNSGTSSPISSPLTAPKPTPIQSTQPGDPGPTGITPPLNSTHITTAGLENLYNANNTPTLTSMRSSSEMDRTVSKLTTSVITGVTTITTTSASNGAPSTIISLSSFTQITTFPVTDGPTTSTFTSSKNNNAATVAGGVVGGLVGLLLIFVVIFFFLRRHRRRARNDGLYGPVVPHNSSSSEVQTHELLPSRAVTPFLWPQDLPLASNEPIAPASDAGRGIIGTSNSGVVTNPFEPTYTRKLVDVDSVRSLRIAGTSNPLEDNANSHLAGYPRRVSFDTTYLEPGTWPGGENSGGNASSSVPVNMMAQANHLRLLSDTSTVCLYPVLESSTLLRHVSSGSELSYATLDPERVANLQAQQPIMRYPSTSSTSSSNVNIGYAV